MARLTRAAALLAMTVALLAGCSDDHSSLRPAVPRTYFMGFSSFPPRPDLNLADPPWLSQWDVIFARRRQ